MNRTETVVIGAGAIGMLCAAPLAKTEGIALRIAASGERLNRLREHGLYLNGQPLQAEFATEGGNRTADFILIATKAAGYPDALELAAEFTGSQTVVVPLLNGISAEETAKRRFPENDVVCGFFLGHASVRNGNRIEHDGVGTFYLGTTVSEAPEAVRHTAELFRRAKISCAVPEDMRAALWKKFVLNIGVNQATAHFRADYGELQRDPARLEFTMRLMCEASAVAEKLGIAGAADMPEAAMHTILTMPGNVKTSMFQDVEAGRPTEVALFAGTLCRLGRETGIPTPLNDEIQREFSGK